MKTLIAIPARYASTRFPGKPLVALRGPDGEKILIRRSWEAAMAVQGIDRALICVVVALLALGLVMVYSASVALPDSPRFSRYAPTHFLTRHMVSIALAFVVALAVLQIPMSV